MFKTRIAWVAVLLLVISFCLPASSLSAADAPAPANNGSVTKLPVDLSFVPADSFGIIVLQPSRLMNAPELKMFPLEILTAMMQKEAGLDPANIDQVVVVMDNLLQPRPPEPGIIFHLNQPVQPDKVFPPLMIGATEAMSGGKKYFKPKNAWQQAVYLPDNKTVVVAKEETLIKMMAATLSATSPLHQRAKSLDTSAQIAAVFSLDAVREPLNQMLAQAPPLPPPLADMPKLLQLSSAYEMRVSLNGTMKVELLFHAKDAASAPEVEKVAKQAIDFGRQMLQGQMEQQFAKAKDPIEQAAGKYAQRIVTQMFETIKINRNGTDVTISSEQNFGLASLGTSAGLLLPAIAKVREAAQRTASMNNVRQLLMAMIIYENVYRRLPSRAIFSKEGKPLLSWRVQILPYIEEEALYKQFHLDEPWDSDHNKSLISQMPTIFNSPAETAADGKTRYVVPVGKGTIFEGEKGLTLAQITDGLSKTILLVEVGPEKAVTWTKPDDMEYNPEKPLAGFGPISPTGFNIGFADGVIRRIMPTVDLEVLKAMFTYAGGEVVEIPD